MIIHLGVHVQYKCVHKKFGVILYRTNGDLLKSLSWALGSSSTTQNNNSQHHPNTFNNLQTHQILHQASIIINEMLRATRESIDNGLNIDEYITGVEPMLWEFIVALTESIRSKQHPSRVESDHLIQLKKIRRFFILCSLQYCCNVEQPLPIHSIVADVFSDVWWLNRITDTA